jgi:hypothetical protein
MPGLAINADPTTQTPDPLRRLPGLIRQRVIHTIGTPDHKEAPSDLMQKPADVFPAAAVNDQIPYPGSLRHAGFRLDFDGTPLPQHNRMLPGSSIAVFHKQEQNRAK